MADVAVGRSASNGFDMGAPKAVGTRRVDGRCDGMPGDSDASIFTAGLLGGQYIGITPGGAEEFLHEGSRIEFVQDAIVLENLISKYLFGQADKGNTAEPSPQE